ncbi:hypothetical protein C8R42DRAFT_662822 [Lentinula raphanica]|nr:hypothetical protein C8R42DRAFT_662822 [Lentinula raphanica]
MATAISTLSSTPSMASSSSQSSDYSRVVRFDDECVLIPELRPIKRPIIITKSYSLPLWTRRKPSDDEPAEEPSSPVLKVPFPNFKAKPSRSTSRGREPVSPLSPCLVHRSPSSPSADDVPHRKLERRPSLPSPSLVDKGKPLPTIPLRSCCPDCVSTMEECLKKGEAWVEKFTRGARRRRSSSSDSDCGFTPVASTHHDDKDVAVVRVGISASITVDEVDKRRRSRELDTYPDFMTHGVSVSPSSSPVVPHVPSAIIEEDEDQLFPLPSPRRSPNASPANSSSASPMPSPNGSTSQLSSVSASKEPPKIPEEGILAKSLMRKGRCEKGLLTPEADIGPALPSISHSVLANEVSPPSPFSPSDTTPPSSATPATFVDSPPSTESPNSLPSPISPRHPNSHPYLPERSRESPTKERRPSLGATMLRATGDVLKGVSFNSGSLHAGMSL